MQRGNHELLANDFYHRRAAYRRRRFGIRLPPFAAIQQTNAIILAACGSDERPCQVAAHRGQIELGEIMVRTWSLLRQVDRKESDLLSPHAVWPLENWPGHRRYMERWCKGALWLDHYWISV